MLVMYLNVDCMIFFNMLDDFFDNGYDLFDFIYIYVKILWCNLKKKLEKNFYDFFF